MEPIVYSIVKYKDEKDSFLWLIMQFTALVTVLAQGTINIDFNKTSGDLNRMFNECMGAGRANGGLRADWQQQFAYVRKKCGLFECRTFKWTHQNKRRAPFQKNWTLLKIMFAF